MNKKYGAVLGVAVMFFLLFGFGHAQADTCPSITVSGVSYFLNPCTVSATITDGQGDQNFSASIVPSDTTVNYGFSVRGYGVGLPTYGIISNSSSGGARSTTSLSFKVSDSVFSAAGSQTQVFTGYIPIHIFTGSEANNDNNFLNLNVTVTVNPNLTNSTGTTASSGCTAGEIYNSITGQTCPQQITAPVVTTPTINSGCGAGIAYSLTTGQACPQQIVVTTPVATVCPAGSVYSPTTGQTCTTTMVSTPPTTTQLSSGCATNVIYSTTTGQVCMNSISLAVPLTPTVAYPAGCVSSTGFSSTTGAPCNRTSVVSSSGEDTTTDCSVQFFTKTLRVGQRSDQVDALQAVLVSKGYLAETSATGYFNAKTQIALKAFQKANGVLVTGYTGSTVRAKLNAIWQQQCISDNSDDGSSSSDQ